MLCCLGCGWGYLSSLVHSFHVCIFAQYYCIYHMTDDEETCIYMYCVIVPHVLSELNSIDNVCVCVCVCTCMCVVILLLVNAKDVSCYSLYYRDVSSELERLNTMLMKLHSKVAGKFNSVSNSPLSILPPPPSL